MKALLERLFAHETLTRAEARQALLRITEGEVADAQIAAFATAFRMRPIRREELEGFRDALLERCRRVDLEGRPTIDIVGTGGDGKNTFNISTCAAFVVAGAGHAVSKHGNYGASSVSGSSNVLQHLGYTFTDDTDALRRQLDEAGICFFHAPLFHPALKHVARVRKELGVKTFFNMLGPLVNPAQPRYQLFGTFSMELNRMYQYVLQSLGKRFAVVHSLDGYDEVSLTAPVQVRTHFSEQRLSPEDMGLPECSPEELSGGNSVEEAACIFVRVLENRSTPAQKNVVLANAALALQTIEPEASWEDCLGRATESLESGRALEVLKRVTA